MNVFIVLYQHYESDEVEVLDVYLDEDKANRRVHIERNMIEANPDGRLRDECWYRESEVIA